MNSISIDVNLTSNSLLAKLDEILSQLRGGPGASVEEIEAVLGPAIESLMQLAGDTGIKASGPLASVNALTSRLQGVNTMSAATEKLEQFRVQIDSATNAIAAKIQALMDQVNSGAGATPEEITAVLQPVVDQLNAMAAPTP